MKIKLIVTLLFCSNCILFAQNEEPEFQIRATALSWMPNGKALMLNIMKFDKTRKTPPVAKKILYHIKQQKLKALSINGSGVSVAPNGKSAAYIQPTTNHIYLYHFKSKKEELLLNDTLRKYAIDWSSDSKNLVYNIALNGTGQDATIEVCTYNISTRQVKQITESGKHKSYSPVWNPKNNKIVYYLEKGDDHDQIYVTDSEGSYHVNLTNDMNTHNYFPSWLNEHTILYTQSPDQIMTMQVDGSNRQQIQGIQAFQAKYNARSGKIAYLDRDSNVMLYDWKNKTSEILLDSSQMDDALFNNTKY
ncbi:MAG: hypothetical protein IPJ74_03105 [Saprospiraceae bacterium]|nr:hypothetical protein [Saprospiraceae bacterium]